MNMMHIITNSINVPEMESYSFKIGPSICDSTNPQLQSYPIAHCRSIRFVKDRKIFTLCPGDEISAIIFEALASANTKNETLNHELNLLKKKLNALEKE